MSKSTFLSTDYHDSVSSDSMITTYNVESGKYCQYSVITISRAKQWLQVERIKGGKEEDFLSDVLQGLGLQC